METYRADALAAAGVRETFVQDNHSRSSRGVLRGLLMDTVTTEAIGTTRIFDGRAIEGLIRDHMERRINAGYHLWGLLTLFLWMKRWKVEAPREAGAPAETVPVFATR